MVSGWRLDQGVALKRCEFNERTVRMRYIIGCTLIVLVLVAANLAGCGTSEKKGSKSEPTTITTTLGQELLDLDKAYKDGIITQKEYEKAKKALIEKRTK